LTNRHQKDHWIRGSTFWWGYSERDRFSEVCYYWEIRQLVLCCAWAKLLEKDCDWDRALGVYGLMIDPTLRVDYSPMIEFRVTCFERGLLMLGYFLGASTFIVERFG
jgi:hypothetical protein